MIETRIVTHHGNAFLQVELIEVKQKSKYFYLAKIKAQHFLEIYTVRPATYDIIKNSELANSFPEEKDYYNHLIEVDQRNIDHKDFQREAKSERVSNITKFLETEDFAFFPNTIIANCELINESKEFAINQNNTFLDFLNIENRPKHLSFLHEENNSIFLFIPYEENSVLVIDGQHRLEGLKKSNLQVKSNYELIISFIIGYDRSVIAKQFYTINYEQKSVNKSLLYQLTGEFAAGVGEIAYLHTVVKLLNELQDSPFYKRLKMLGVTPKDASIETKQRLTISQAFLVDGMVRYISNSAKSTLYPPIFLKYYNEESLRVEIIKTIARFFTAVKLILPEWERPQDNILSKGMGVGALIKVFNLIYPLIFHELEYSWDQIKSLKAIDYTKYLSGIQNIDFTNNGRYGGIGSGGTVNKLKEDIIKNNTYWGPFNNFQEFENKFKDRIITFSQFLN